MNAITKTFTGQKRIRKSFGRIPEVAPMPNLIDVQRASYEAFLQMGVDPDLRAQAGLQEERLAKVRFWPREHRRES